MPFVIGSRREWMRVAAGAAASVALPAATASDWVLLSDTHIAEDPSDTYRGFKPHDNLRLAVREIMQKRPEGVLINGDLARLEGRPGDYRALRQLLEGFVHGPAVAVTLGNHDDRKQFLEGWNTGGTGAGQSMSVRDKHVVVIDARPVRMILLDSLMAVNVTPGLLGKAQRDWLEGYLESRTDKVPTVLFVHHTLTDDDAALLDSDRLLRICERHRSVKAIFYGHAHRYELFEQSGLHLVNIPAIAYNFLDTQPVGWLRARFSAEGAALTLRAIGGETKSDGTTKQLRWRS